MPRPGRKAPLREPNPLDDFSSWDVRIAKVIYYGVMLASAITVFGVWSTILGFIPIASWEVFLNLGLGYQIAIIAGAITGHLALLVLFYSMFRGGIVRMCKILFKDRLVAKKWEDYYGLRMLIGVTLIGLYVTIISLIIGLLPTVFFESIAALWIWQVENFSPGLWILWVGFIVFVVVGIIFIGLVLWNHGVYAVLRQVKSIEEEMEVDENLRKERLKKASEKVRRKEYKKETGGKATYRGQDTAGYIEWKKKNGLK